MSIDQEIVELVRQAELDLALLNARLERASPEERLMLLRPTGICRTLGWVEDFEDGLDEASWALYLAHEKAERQDDRPALDVLMEQAEVAAHEEVARRIQAGTLCSDPAPE
jgi:hypothetical protein